MPVVARFDGITVKMYLRMKEHNPPHIHASTGEQVGVFSIYDGIMYEGDLSMNRQQKVKRFIEYYRDRLLVMWETQEYEVLDPVE